MHDAKGMKETWARFCESKAGAKVFGMSWRKLHSPMLFHWGKALQPQPRHWPKEVLESTSSMDWMGLDKARTALHSDQRMLNRKDLGAGSRVVSNGSGTQRRVAHLAATSLTSQRDLEAMCRWLAVLSPGGSWLELGTSLGLTSAAVAQLGWEVETWEGCPETLAVAREVWSQTGVLEQILARQGDFRDLTHHIPSNRQWDVVFLDGLHEEQATLELASTLEPHVKVGLVVDDICWSVGMHRAWRALQDRPEWRVSFSWRGRGFLLKAPHMERQRFCLA